jgi:hypothetical protein
LFLDSGGTFAPLSIPAYGVNVGINNAGDILANNNVYYSNGLVVPINVPGAYTTSANGINDLGQVVGTPSGPPYDNTLMGFVYTNEVYQ